MPEKPLTSLLSPNSNLRSKVASLDSAIDTLRANGMESQANMLYSNLQQAIANKDIDNLKAYSGQLMALNTKNLTVPAEARTPKDEVARSIEQLVSVADSRNIAIPPAILNDAANAFVSKDQGAVRALANSIGTLVDAGIKVQTDEQKEQRQLTDGSIVLIGSQSGTRYNNMGTPIPFGNQNAEQFSAFAERAYLPTREVVASVLPGLGDVLTAQVEGVPVVPLATSAEQIEIGANPEAYAATQVPDFTSTQLKEQAISEARDLYDQGNPVEAAQKLNAYGIQGSLGGAVSPNELEDIFGKKRIRETTPSQDIEKSPSVDFFDSSGMRTSSCSIMSCSCSSIVFNFAC
jgi:hypothetical protein